MFHLCITPIKKSSQVGYKNTDDIMHIFEFGMNEF